MDSVYCRIDMGPPGDRFPDGVMVDVAPTEGGLAVQFAGGDARLPAEWLRDNCFCDECRILQTDERRWQPWRLPAAPQVGSFELVGGMLTVVWTDGHRSTFDDRVWERIRVASRRGAYTAELWRAGHSIGRFAHDDVLADSDAHLAMFESFVRDGAVVVTGAPAVAGTVLEFSKSIGLTLIDSSLGFLFDVMAVPDGYNIAFTREEVPPHNDNAQYLRPPSGQILSMVTNEATGGESIVVDGWCVLEQLRRADPTAVDVLARVEVGHRQYSTTADGFGRAPLVVRDPLGRFTHLRFSNQLMQPLPFDHPDLDAWYEAYRTLGRMVTDPANQVRFRLNGGDMLFVNGYRVLHARSAFATDGHRHLQDVYFNTDDVHSVISMLTGETTNAMVHS